MSGAGFVLGLPPCPVCHEPVDGDCWDHPEGPAHPECVTVWCPDCEQYVTGDQTVPGEHVGPRRYVVCRSCASEGCAWHLFRAAS